MQKIALDLGKLAECAESSAKVVVRKEYELTCHRLSNEPRGRKLTFHDASEDSVKKRNWR